MTLEEKVSFYSKEQALKFRHYLKSFGCSSRMNLEYDLLEISMLKATIPSFYQLIDIMDKKCPGKDYEEIKTELDTNLYDLKEFFASHTIGDKFLSLENKLEELILQDLENRKKREEGEWDEAAEVEKIEGPEDEDGDEDEEDEESKERKRVIDGLIRKTTFFDLLVMNGILESVKEENAFRVSALMKPEDVMVMQYAKDFEEADDNDLSEANIFKSIITLSIPRYIVTTDGGIILNTDNGDLDEIDDILHYLEADDDDIEKFTHDIYLKHGLVYRIRQLVFEGIQTEEKILEKLIGSKFVPGAGIEMVYNLDKEFLSKVISDMCRENILTKKNGKLRIK